MKTDKFSRLEEGDIVGLVSYKTLVYVIERGLYEGDYSDMSDEDFKEVAELEGRVYSLKDFQDAFNETPEYERTFEGVERELDIIRFINVKL